MAATPPLIRRSEHQVGGMVTREQIENVPLNGRNFLELAKLEPGVTNTTRLADGRAFVSSLGGGLQTIPRIGATRVMIDGANVRAPGTVGVLLQVSQDVVQEFQMATVNFDPASSLTSNGAINIVTRSGSNAYQGSGFYFYRDNRLAAYPGLTRDPKNPNPSFERKQFRAYIGGPIQKIAPSSSQASSAPTRSGSCRSSRSTSLPRSAAFSRPRTQATCSVHEWMCASTPITVPSHATPTIATARSRISAPRACLRAGRGGPTRLNRAWRPSRASCRRGW